MGQGVERRDKLGRRQIPPLKQELKEDLDGLQHGLGLFVAVHQDEYRPLRRLVQKYGVKRLGRRDHPGDRERSGFAPGKMLQQGLKGRLPCRRLQEVSSSRVDHCWCTDFRPLTAEPKRPAAAKRDGTRIMAAPILGPGIHAPELPTLPDRELHPFSFRNRIYI